MKTRYALPIAALLLAGVTGCYVRVSSSPTDANPRLDFETSVVHTGEVSSAVRVLELENRHGGVRVTGSDSSDLKWTQRLKVRAGSELDADRIMNSVACIAEADGDRLKLFVSSADRDIAHSINSDLEIVVPQNAVVRVRNEYGRISIGALNADVDVAGRHGEIEIRNVRGTVRAENSYSALVISETGPATLKNRNGLINATQVHGDLDAQTSYASLSVREVQGNVRLRNQNGRIEAESVGMTDAETSYASLEVRKVSGDVRLVNRNGRLEAREVAGNVNAVTSYATLEVSASGGSLFCENRNGSVRVEAGSALKALEANTSYASLEVQLPAAMKPAIEARTSYAEVISDFPVLMKPSSVEAATGIDEGAPRVRLQNQNGSIRVTKQR